MKSFAVMLQIYRMTRIAKITQYSRKEAVRFDTGGPNYFPTPCSLFIFPPGMDGHLGVHVGALAPPMMPLWVQNGRFYHFCTPNNFEIKFTGMNFFKKFESVALI